MKVNLHRLFGITAVLVAFILSHDADAASSHRAQAFCKKHHVPCTLKHGCVAYLTSNATLNYFNGEYYNYVHKGNFYNYIDKGKYYAYFNNGRFYNKVKLSESDVTCQAQLGYWQQGEWVVPDSTCK